MNRIVLRALLPAAAVLLLFPLLASAESAHMSPGKYEVTMEMEMPGMPMKMPPQTFSHCVTKEQAERPEPPKSRRDSDCTFLDYKISGNVVTYKMKCEKSDITGEGKMTFEHDSYVVLTHIKTGDREMSQKIIGKRVGDCDK